ncbi:MAG: MBL fold metallo-hydrolase [Phycisphaeraceae bacterium]
MPSLIKVQTFCIGPWQTNCYVVSRGEHCWIVDAGYEPEPMIQHIRDHELTPKHVVLTHAHLDHIAGLHAIRGVWPELPILIHEAERDFLGDPALNLSGFLDEAVVAPAATDVLHHGQTLTLDGIEFQILHTPGHSPGGITLHQAQAGIALVGDTLFAGSIGRYDFPTSDGPLLLRSITEQLMTLPDNTRVLPGHGPQTTIGQERLHNPFLQKD